MVIFFVYAMLCPFFCSVYAQDNICNNVSQVFNAIDHHDVASIEHDESWLSYGCNLLDEQLRSPLFHVLMYYKEIDAHSLLSLIQQKPDLFFDENRNDGVFDYALRNCSHDIVNALYESMIVHRVEDRLFHDDISVCIADLKVSDDRVIVCELGELSRSRFKGYDFFYGHGRIWSSFWRFCRFFNIIPWMSQSMSLSEQRDERQLRAFERLGGGYFRTLKQLLFDDAFLHVDSKKKLNYGFQSVYSAALISDVGYAEPIAKYFLERAPHTLLINHVMGGCANNKLLMDKVFRDAGLEKYRPSCVLLDYNYDPKLLNVLTREINGDYVVIKPLDAAKGQGVIITPKRELHKTVRNIIKTPENLIKNEHDETYTYWLSKKAKSILIEEFVPSKLIECKGKKYDATMRVIFILFCDQGKIGLTFLGSYWKLPPMSYSQKGDLNLIHKSSIRSDVESSAKVNPRDYAYVKSVLRNALPTLYIHLLQQREYSFYGGA